MKAKNLLLALLCGVVALDGVAQSDTIDVTEKTKAQIYFEGGKVNFVTRNKAFRLKLDNRVYADAAYYFPTQSTDGFSSKPNSDIEDDDGTFRFNNGVSLRRVRFGVKATLYEKWFAELDLDFAYNEVEIKDMFLGYKFNDNWSIKAGHFKMPMSMERLTSSRYLTFNERPMPVEVFGGGRRLGVSATGWGRYWWVSAGIFGPKADIMQKEKNRGSDGLGIAARAATAPINSTDWTLHIGGYFRYQNPDANGTENGFVEFRTFPESRVDRRRFVRVEMSNVNYYNTYGLELALRWKKLLLQGEYIYTDVSRFREENGAHIALNNASFNGWYVSASYMILGNQRQYSHDDAEFAPSGKMPKGGTLELAARVSHVNLNDFHDAAAVITGGSAYGYGVNINYRPIENVLLGLNYTYMDNDKYADDKGHITYEGKALKEAIPEGIDFHILQLRMMVSF